MALCPEHGKLMSQIATIATISKLTQVANEKDHSEIKLAIRELSGRNHKTRKMLFVGAVVLILVLSNNLSAIIPFVKSLL